MSTRLPTVIVALLAVCAPAAAADRPPLIASQADAFVSHQSGSDVWSIGSANLEVVFGFNASRTLSLQRMINPTTGRSWDITAGPDVGLTAGTERLTLTSSGAVAFVSAVAETTPHGVTLTFNFEHRAQKLQIARVYAVYAGSPTVETWTRVATTGDGVTLTDLVGWQMTMPLGQVRWLGGLRGDSASGASVEDAFVVTERDLDPEEHVEIGSEGRSSEVFIPLIFVGGERDEFFGGLMWSGAWHAALERPAGVDDRLRVTLYFSGVSTAITAAKALEIPHTFFGITARAINDESGALHQFVMRGIRRGRPFTPLVTYNSWFPYGTQVNEDLMVDEIRRAREIGAELVVLDAGWYVGAGDGGDYDFESGLGSWVEDQFRFPSGIASLSDYAHDFGLKFGIWVEPERVALAWVDKPGLAREPWLASHNGDYGSGLNGQICLAGREGRQWVLNQLIAMIDRIHPDYIKWDNNFWINCNRPGHGHGPDDGNLAHVQALYEVLATLRERYPDLIIENVSGGGARIDFGMLAYTDVAWMDDRTSPASLVRHNIEGLTFAFPPAYLLSFIIDADGEPFAGGDDLPLLTRSRMPGVLGLTYRAAELPQDTIEALTLQVAEYKSFRDIIAQADATLISNQAPVDVTGWDAIAEVSEDARTAIIFAFKGSAEPGHWIARPRGLIADATYDVSSIDVGSLGSARGDALMQDGIEILHDGGSRAHILLLRAR